MGERRLEERAEIQTDPVYRAALSESERASGPRPEFLAGAERAAQIAGGAVAVLGLTVDVAWVVGYEPLTSVLPQWPTMKFWTATGLAVLGLLLLTHPWRTTPTRRRAGLVAALFVLVPSAGFLVEYATGVGLGIDNPFGLDASPADTLPGRPSAMTALNLAILAVVCLAIQGRRLVLAQSSAFLSAGLAIVALTSYAFDAQDLFRVGVFSTMAVHTAASILVLALGSMALTLSRGPLRMVVEDGAGGILVRRVLPASLLTQFVIFVAAYQIVDHRDASPAFTTAVAVTLSMAVISLLVWYQGKALSEAEVRRTGAEDALVRVRELLETRDTLAHKLAEREQDLRKIIDTSPDAFISINREGLVTAWNPAAERIFGWDREEVLQRPLHRFIVPDHQVWARDAEFPDMVHRIEAFRGRASDVTAVRKDGTPVRVELTLWPATDDEAQSFHAFARDITARRSAEERLVQANADLQEFAAIAAHDLRNPLVTIRLAGEMLAQSLKDEPREELNREWVERIMAATARGQELINDLLEYSALSSGAAQTSRIDLTRLVEDVADQAALGSSRNVEVNVAQLPIIEGDEPRLRQLFANLFGNAVKYVPEDRDPCIEVSARTGRRLVRISVCDNGTGVPDYDKESIFQVFQRGSSTTTTPGTGVGLAICRKVAERHGGTLHVEDSPGGGACFVLELPRWPGSMTIGTPGETSTSLPSTHAN